MFMYDTKYSTNMESITQTVKIPLRCSNRKEQLVRKTIKENKKIINFYSQILPSFNHNDIDRNNATLYRKYKQGDIQSLEEDFDIKSNIVLEAIEDVVNSYKSGVSNGNVEKEMDFTVDYFRMKGVDVDVVENEEGYGIKCSFIPYKPLWFHVKENPFVSKYLERIVEDEAKCGTCELRFRDGQLFAHLVVNWEVESIDSEQTARRVIGVDLGEKNIYTSVFLSEDGFEDVCVRSGDEFRHHREKLKKRRNEFQRKDDLRAVKRISGEHERYTEQVLDTASREIVKQAVEHQPCKIVLEDLTNYRKEARGAIHDWPFALMQEKITYKAKAEGLPVDDVDPRYTSQKCRVCGHTSSSNRNGDSFECGECGYQVHADVNGAMNIALRGSDFERDEFGVNRETEVRDSLFDY
jgi:putative transposase